MPRLTVALSLLALTLAATSTATAGLPAPFKKSDSKTATIHKIHKNLRYTTYLCKRGAGATQRSYCKATRWLRNWLKRLTYVEPVLYIPHLKDWLCIHRFEGSWTDSGDPYWGGLQMDKSFMLHFAPGWLLRKGWANSWTPAQQMWVAERAYKESGFARWPNTARYCHLM